MIYDLIIIGAGPAGLSAAIYSARYKLNFLLVGKINDSAIAKSHKIENYPGAMSIGGKDLVETWRQQALNLGAKCISENVVSIQKKDIFEIELGDGNRYQSRNIILAMGTVKKKLGVLGEEKFEGSGVSYCATCDAPFFRSRKVAVVGGNDSAAKTALHLADFAEKVYLIYRGDKLRAEPSWVEKIAANSKIEIIYNTNITEILGDGIVIGVVLEGCHAEQEFCHCEQSQQAERGNLNLDCHVGSNLLAMTERNKHDNILAVSGVFIEIGAEPNTTLAKKMGVSLDEAGYIEIKASGETNIEGLYAAGDLTTGSNKFRQIITAAAEGAVAAASVYGKAKNG